MHPYPYLCLLLDKNAYMDLTDVKIIFVFSKNKNKPNIDIYENENGSNPKNVIS